MVIEKCNKNRINIKMKLFLNAKNKYSAYTMCPFHGYETTIENSSQNELCPNPSNNVHIVFCDFF